MFQRLKNIFSSGDVEPRQDDLGDDILKCWTTIQLDGRRVDVFDPATDAPFAGCVLFLHGHGRIMLSDNAIFSNLFRQHNLAAICPDGQRSWWLNRVCQEFDSEQTPQQWLLDRLLPFIKDRWQIVPPQVGLLGISMGGQGVLQLAFRDARMFPVVAAISPAVDFDQLYGAGLPLDNMFESREEARQDTVVLNLHPLSWPRHQFFCCDPADVEWFEGCARLGMKLSSSGIMHERDLDTTAGGHAWDYFNHMAPKAVEHIAQGLRKVATA